MSYKHSTRIWEQFFSITLFTVIAAGRFILETKIGTPPIGYDASNPYILAFLDYSNGFWHSITNFSLLYYFFEICRNLGFDALITIKLTGVVLYTALCICFFLTSRALAKWSTWWALLATLLFSLQLSTLRFSWDLYRNELGLCFAMLTGYFLLQLRNKGTQSPHLIAATVLCILGTLASHQMVSLLLVAVLGFGLILRALDRSYPHYSFPLVLVGLLAWPFLAQYITIQNLSLWGHTGTTLPAEYLLPLDLAKLLFLPILLPLSLLGIFIFKQRILLITTLLLVIHSFSITIFRTEGFILWDRWMYFLGIPLSFYAIVAIKWMVKKLPNHFQAIVATLIVLPLLYPAFSFIYPKKSLYGSNLDSHIFDLFPGYMMSNAYISNTFERDRSKNIGECLKQFAATNPDNLPLLVPGNFTGITSYYLQTTEIPVINTTPAPQEAYFLLSYTRITDQQFTLVSTLPSGCPLYHHTAKSS